MAKYIFVIDLDRCIGCQGCLVSCKLENDIVLGMYRNSVCTIGPTGDYPNMEMYFLPVMCQQCEEPNCVAACPTGACQQKPGTNIVFIDSQTCIGCRRCSKSCPYGVITFYQDTHVADKCNACIDSWEEESEPACVRNCAGGALHFGNIENPKSNVSILLKKTKKEHIYTLQDDGNKPSHRYILRKCTWQNLYLPDCEGWKGTSYEPSHPNR